jgi:hypothetical protein
MGETLNKTSNKKEKKKHFFVPDLDPFVCETSRFVTRSNTLGVLSASDSQDRDVQQVVVS